MAHEIGLVELGRALAQQFVAAILLMAVVQAASASIPTGLMLYLMAGAVWAEIMQSSMVPIGVTLNPLTPEHWKEYLAICLLWPLVALGSGLMLLIFLPNALYALWIRYNRLTT